MSQITIDGLRGLDAGEVFVKSGSHRATSQLSSVLGYKPQTFYSFERRKPAATSYFVATDGEFEKIRAIRGVSKARFSRHDRWQPHIRSYERNPTETVVWQQGKIDWRRGDEENPTFYGSVGGQERLDVWRDPDGVWGVSLDCAFVGPADSPVEAFLIAEGALARAPNPRPKGQRLLAGAVVIGGLAGGAIVARAVLGTK